MGRTKGAAFGMRAKPNMTFRTQLIAERHRLDITQTEAAKILRIALRTVAAWEGGDNAPYLAQIGALAVLRAIPTPGDAEVATESQPMVKTPGINPTAYFVDLKHVQFPGQP